MGIHGRSDPLQSLASYMSFQFSKYQGLGNDFLMLDGRQSGETDFLFGLTPELVVQLCDRRFGVGGDGVILALPPNAGGELRMRILTPMEPSPRCAAMASAVWRAS